MSSISLHAVKEMKINPTKNENGTLIGRKYQMRSIIISFTDGTPDFDITIFSGNEEFEPTTIVIS